MITLFVFVFVFVFVLYIAINMFVDFKREKRIEALLSATQKKHKSSRINSFIVKFGKEHRGELEQKVRDAGIHSPQLAIYYFPIKVLFFAVLLFFVWIMDIAIETKFILVVISVITAVLLPDLILSLKQKAVVRKISINLPYLLDMMSVCVQTGMTIEASFAYLSKELETFDRDLCYQIKKTSDFGKIQGIDKALYNLSERVPSPEMSSFVLTIIQNIQYGSSISMILSDLAEDMRKMQLLTVEEKMGKLSAKMSIPLILLIMMPIVILILAPGVVQMGLV
ncbi:biotin synthase [Vibrio sp. 10N.261.46.E8]|uniref:type II secretion system F family protein n=1 Tax=unclassified Vibrio TaxID=2614977 RepID=UPI000CC66EAC|nr:biotin synthase [Vibrio sp. 10N.286.45.B6]PML89119.1 biotin synthase [Vibrio sp. 10N.261.49.E11]PMM71090.1 biotin synthase [Vibrio sp. 10N.261.46.F12]PMM90085.1 biotin synthase [Vibrio sp. 10N.261.46.E8]PMN36757.1 biotin synthase [Vibrio sp. 10N.261.45.E2]PMN45966.1 biotin synthase [Vibrio sp. 10N.261.45.E11]PMN82166.1 biotin synthase [Vibrio sp. 10N.261.45.A6]PMN87289.1 biotin synthase [Vibrio sp. 10N.261.45.A1]